MHMLLWAGSGVYTENLNEYFGLAMKIEEIYIYIQKKYDNKWEKNEFGLNSKISRSKRIVLDLLR